MGKANKVKMTLFIEEGEKKKNHGILTRDSAVKTLPATDFLKA